MYRIKLIKILLSHSPKFLKRFFLLMFRKNTKLEFNYSLRNEKHKRVNLIENQIILDLDIKNGFILRVGMRYIPLFQEHSRFTLKIPNAGLGKEIDLKVFGFFESSNANIPLHLKGAQSIRPLLSKNNFFSTIKVKHNICKGNSNAKIISPEMNISSSIDKPKLSDRTLTIIPSTKLYPFTEPFFEYQIEKLELKLNQKL